ncbi:DUF1153 domain-containing protein [Porphyrobacter sp. AAP60]|uniref:DUF1153 domain-containing protein n=1 Tax=Porphyrobacter sp. AAP60 TaxID=1523423 RepID=UPI0006B8D47E|nr:DUF1153 domain-containing protein [Porphyrobacter sp. AAP60]KPF63383.1 hypothetical protein IP79_09540 [Porphyrobacter sp. AAP60]MDP5102642.1 DUF1153 domain-containing protein [Erythrobacter sp.]
MAYPNNVSIADAIKSYYALPRNHRVHWSKARKDEVVRAVRDEAISFAEARNRYLLSRSEFAQWERDYIATGGDAASDKTRMQDA